MTKAGGHTLHFVPLGRTLHLFIAGAWYARRCVGRRAAGLEDVGDEDDEDDQDDDDQERGSRDGGPSYAGGGVGLALEAHGRLRFGVELSGALRAIEGVRRVVGPARLANGHVLLQDVGGRAHSGEDLCLQLTVVDSTLAPVHHVVEGRKTRLRPASWGFSEEELLRRFRWSQDDELQYWSGSIPGGRTFGRFKDTVGERDWPHDGKRISYAIYTRDDDLIGMVSCYSIDWHARNGELGVYLGEKAYWGHGYGTDAIMAFLRHLFTDIGLEMVYLHTYETNERARRSYERVGFHVTERRRRYSTRVGYHDEVKMVVARETFERLHGPGIAPSGP